MERVEKWGKPLRALEKICKAWVWKSAGNLHRELEKERTWKASTGCGCAIHRRMWINLEFVVDVGGDVAQILRKRVIAHGKLLLDLLQRMNNGGVVATKFSTNVR